MVEDDERRLKQWNDELNQLEKEQKQLSDQLRELGEKPPPFPRQLSPPPPPAATPDTGLTGKGGPENKPPAEGKGPTFFPPDIQKWMQEMGFPPARPKSGPKMK